MTMMLDRSLSWMSVRVDQIDRRAAILIAAWVLAMVALPILIWTVGEDVVPVAVTGSLLLQFAAVAAVVGNACGWPRILMVLFAVATATWGMEALGAKSGFPFGSYHYTDRLQPQLAGVPLLIPLAWFMMLVPSWAVAKLIAGKSLSRPYGPALFVLVSGAAITAWDLFLDPLMVEWDFWRWDVGGGYFGIPWSNTAGWLLTGMLATALVRPFDLRLPLRSLLLVYAVVWVLQLIGQALFWGQPGPALAGGIAMGALLGWSARNMLLSRTP
jgi:putative membrane protein